MSLNLTLTASRDIIVVKTGKKDIQIKDLPLPQTLTILTKDILARQETHGFKEAFNYFTYNYRIGWDFNDLSLTVDRLTKEGWTLEFSYI